MSENGFVPAPKAGDQDKFLSIDGTWKERNLEDYFLCSNGLWIKGNKQNYFLQGNGQWNKMNIEDELNTIMGVYIGNEKTEKVTAMQLYDCKINILNNIAPSIEIIKIIFNCGNNTTPALEITNNQQVTITKDDESYLNNCHLEQLNIVWEGNETISRNKNIIFSWEMQIPFLWIDTSWLLEGEIYYKIKGSETVYSIVTKPIEIYGIL